MARGLDSHRFEADDCRGALLAVGIHLPPNIPAEMLDRYFAYLLPRLAKAT